MRGPASFVLAIFMCGPAIGWSASATGSDPEPAVFVQITAADNEVPVFGSSANDCPRTQPAGDRVDVQFEISPARIRRELSADQLGDLAFHGPKSQVLGLTKSDLHVETAVDFRTLPFGDSHCYWVDNVGVRLRYQVLDVFIAAKYSPDSCPYEAILEHEQKHVLAARRHFENVAPNLRTVFISPRIPTSDAPSVAASTAAARHDVNALLEELTQPVLAGFKKAMEASRAAIDTPEEYNRVRDRCPTW